MAVQELCRRGGYVIVHEYETAWLCWQGGKLLIGDHYGDPSCALIDPDGAWCLTAGEGLVVCLFSQPLSEQFRPSRCKQTELWRRSNPPPNGKKAWFVESVSHLSGGRVSLLVEGQFYNVNVVTLEWGVA
jgi:hypothetical protein